MKKSVIKDKKTFMMLLTYLIMFLFGLISMAFPGMGFDNPVLYSSVIFYTISFFGVFGYFWSHEYKKDYELLFFSLSTIVAASFLFIADFSTISFALGTGFSIFVLLSLFNRSYFTYKFKKTGTNLWILRLISIVLIFFLSVLTIQNFYRDISSVQSVMIGYYFLTYGMISAIELVLITQVNEKTFEKILNGQFEEMKKERTPLKKINENVEELEKISKNIKKIKRKKK